MAGNFRIRYGLAYGRENNFYAGISGQKGYLAGTDGLFAQGNTAPDVTIGTLFYTNNSSATIISSLGFTHPAQGAGNLAGLWEGKEIKIVFLDSNTTLSGTPFKLAGTDNTFAANSFIELLYHTSSWYETSRQQNYSTLVNLNVAASMGLNANYVTSYVLQITGAGTVIQSLSGGVQGNRILLINGNSSASFSISTAGNIVYSSSGANVGIYTIFASGVVELVKTSAGVWATQGR